MQTPPATDEVFTLPDGREAQALALIPFSDGVGYRIPARLTDPRDPIDVVTVVYPADEDPAVLSHPFDWSHVVGRASPLACEIRQGDTLPPPHGVPGRPDKHSEGTGQLTPQTVVSVRWDESLRAVQVVTRDGFQRQRRYLRDPEEALDFQRPPRKRYTHGHARQPESFDGPFVNPQGAQFIFQARNKRGGRPPLGIARYDPLSEPIFHSETGDIMPTIVTEPNRNETTSAVRRSSTIFSETARKLPEVQFILRAEEGVL